MKETQTEWLLRMDMELKGIVYLTLESISASTTIVSVRSLDDDDSTQRKAPEIDNAQSLTLRVAAISTIKGKTIVDEYGNIKWIEATELTSDIAVSAEQVDCSIQGMNLNQGARLSRAQVNALKKKEGALPGESYHAMKERQEIEAKQNRDKDGGSIVEAKRSKSKFEVNGQGNLVSAGIIKFDVRTRLTELFSRCIARSTRCFD